MLQEILTVKSDDTSGRVKSYEAIVKGENIPAAEVPESFKVLVKEMKSLCLNVELEGDQGMVDANLDMDEGDEDRAVYETFGEGAEGDEDRAGAIDDIAAELGELLSDIDTSAEDVDLEAAIDAENAKEAAEATVGSMNTQSNTALDDLADLLGQGEEE